MKSVGRTFCNLLAFGLFMVTFLPSGPLSARTLIEASDAEWRYLDGTTAPPADWNQRGFDAAQWKSGKCPIGFGASRLGATLESKPFAVCFRHEFEARDLKPREGLVILLCVDDGAVIYLNGKELGRINMPDGPVQWTTPALRTVADNEEGFYLRLHVPEEAILPGVSNLLAVEVHNISPKSSDLYFDLALKTLPGQMVASVTPAAAAVVAQFNQTHYLGANVQIPDGYIDGGRRMKFDDSGQAASAREILAVDRAVDTELAADLAFARSSELRALPELERMQRIAQHIDLETTPLGGMQWLEKSTADLQAEFAGKALLIGDWVDQCHSGVCRHRSLLFKMLADEAGLKAALVRGNYLKEKPPGFAHAWNEVLLEDGRRVIVDVMHNGGKDRFPEITDPYVIEHYRKVDDTPWYRAQPAQ